MEAAKAETTSDPEQKRSVESTEVVDTETATDATAGVVELVESLQQKLQLSQLKLKQQT